MPRKRGNRSPPQEKRSDDDDDFFFDDSSSGKSPHEPQHRNAANARERARMRVLSKAFCRLKTTLPWVPADTKLSKLDTLRLAASYIAHLRALLHEPKSAQTSPHPLSLAWPFAFQHGGALSCSISQRWNMNGHSNETNDRVIPRNNIQDTNSNSYYRREYENEYEDQIYEESNANQACAEQYYSYGFKDNYYDNVRNSFTDDSTIHNT